MATLETKSITEKSIDLGKSLYDLGPSLYGISRKVLFEIPQIRTASSDNLSAVSNHLQFVHKRLFNGALASEIGNTTLKTQIFEYIHASLTRFALERGFIQNIGPDAEEIGKNIAKYQEIKADILEHSLGTLFPDQNIGAETFGKHINKAAYIEAVVESAIFLTQASMVNREFVDGIYLTDLVSELYPQIAQNQFAETPIWRTLALRLKYPEHALQFIRDRRSNKFQKLERVQVTETKGSDLEESKAEAVNTISEVTGTAVEKIESPLVRATDYIFQEVDRLIDSKADLEIFKAKNGNGKISILDQVKTAIASGLYLFAIERNLIHPDSDIPDLNMLRKKHSEICFATVQTVEKTRNQTNTDLLQRRVVALLDSSINLGRLYMLNPDATGDLFLSDLYFEQFQELIGNKRAKLNWHEVRNRMRNPHDETKWRIVLYGLPHHEVAEINREQKFAETSDIYQGELVSLHEHLGRLRRAKPANLKPED